VATIVDVVERFLALSLDGFIEHAERARANPDEPCPQQWREHPESLEMVLRHALALREARRTIRATFPTFGEGSTP
jgi:hypothetical protein